MNSKMKEMQVALLAQPAQAKRPYVSPQWDAIEVEKTNLICTSPRVTPNAPGFDEEDWGNENDIDDGDENEFE